MSNKKNNRRPPTNKPKEEPKVINATELITDTADDIKAVVFNCKRVRVRSTPTIIPHEDNVITELDAGTEVKVLDASNPIWTRVKIGDMSAWIMSEYLQPV